MYKLKTNKMEQTKQTAVEWLVSQLYRYSFNQPIDLGVWQELRDLAEKAKEMENQQSKENYENSNKTLTNTTASQAKDNVKDIVFWGNGDTFKLISKASSVKEGWMKSTKAMEIEGVGCIVQVTTQQGDNVAEALTFVPNVRIEEFYGRDESTVGRRLIKI